MTAVRVVVLGPVFETPQVKGLVATLRDNLSGTTPPVEVGYRGFTEDRYDPLLNVAAEIDSLRPAVMVAWSPQCARYQGYFYRPPVVFVVNGDPAALSLSASSRMSGLTTWAPGLLRAQLAVLKELVPDARRVAMLWDPSDSGSVRAFNDSAEPARDSGLRRESLEARRHLEFDSVFAAAVERDVDAVCLLSSPMSVAHAPRIAQLAVAHRMPLVADLAEFAQAGAPAAYGGNLQATFRRAAFHVRRILEGGRADALGVERLTSPDLVVNERAAQSVGIAIPPSLLARATRRID